MSQSFSDGNKSKVASKHPNLAQEAASEGPGSEVP